MLDARALSEISRVYDAIDRPWIVGFSGGKDSSAVLKLVFNSLVRKRRRDKPVLVVYCDTGVEIPVVRELVVKTLRGLTQEARRTNLPISAKLVEPPLHDRYFVKVIGRGYPPPTNKFRWCTDRLRIDPVQRLVRATAGPSALVLLGVRYGESEERDRTLARHTVKGTPFLAQSGMSEALIYSPIREYSLDKVWETVTAADPPHSIDSVALANLYRGTSGECPIIRDPRGSPCGSGRFGCWTCTVVRKDTAMRNLIDINGYTSLAPLLEFRDWLAQMRDNPRNRRTRRRNGTPGLGPLTLTARREILRRLQRAEREADMALISSAELTAIQKLWESDR